MATSTSTSTNPNNNKTKAVSNASVGTEQQPTVYVDKEIAALEARQPGLEAEIARLEAGIVEAEGLDGQLVQVDLGQLLAGAGEGAGTGADKVTPRLKELLQDSPIFEEVVRSFQSEDELKSAMVAAGVLPAAATNLGLPQKARLANHKASKKVAANPTVAKYLNSPWWMLGIGVLLLFLWGGGPFLFALTGGAIGGTRPKTTTTTPSLTTDATEGATVKAQTRSGATAIPAPRTPRPQSQQERPVGQAAGSNSDNGNDTQQSQNESGVVYLNYMVDPPITSTTSTTITTTATPAAPAPRQEPQSQPMTTPVATTPVPAIPTPGPGAEDAAGSGDGTSNNSSYNRVGQPPTSLGGLNGPHGSFLAPSRLAAPAQGLDVLVQKAIVTESLVIISPTQTLQAGAAVSGTNTSTPNSTNPVSSTIAIKTSIVWPRPGEVLHYGAYPGEIGNCLILGTQSNLTALRHLEQNDEIRLYDRKNNLFVYRVVAFSPTGQPEREINPTSQQDSWIFDTLTPGQALLTIIVNEPLPLPPVDPNATAQAGTGNTPPASVGRDDWANPKKLAYRAVLVGFAPNTGKSSSATSANPVTTPVAVPSQVWQVQPAPLPRRIVLDEDNSAAAPATTTPTPTPAGSSGDTPIDLLAVLRQLAVQINQADSVQSGNGKGVITATPKPKS